MSARHPHSPVDISQVTQHVLDEQRRFEQLIDCVCDVELAASITCAVPKYVNNHALHFDMNMSYEGCASHAQLKTTGLC